MIECQYITSLGGIRSSGGWQPVRGKQCDKCSQSAVPHRPAATKSLQWNSMLLLWVLLVASQQGHLFAGSGTS